MQHGENVVIVPRPNRDPNVSLPDNGFPMLLQSDLISQLNRHRLVRLLAFGQLALMVATGPLWFPTTVYPQVSLIRLSGQELAELEWLLLTVLLASLAVMAVSAKPWLNRTACLVAGLSTLALIVCNQHRLQPWAWQFVVLSLILSVADDRTSYRCWSGLVISIYVWSAWSKMDLGFGATHGYFLLAGLCKSLGLLPFITALPATFVAQFPVIMPLFELLIAIGLAVSWTRRWALIGAAMMHIGLLLALGPLGHGHQPGVLIWNVFFLIQNWYLFSKEASAAQGELKVAGEIPRDPITPNPVKGVGNGIATAIVVAAAIWPSVEAFGYCDHWPAWAVYASRPERVTIFIHSDELSKISPPFQKYLETQWGVDEWYRFRIDLWSLDAVHAPIYPQDRFQVGVALAACHQFELTRIKVWIEGPANRWTGARTERTYFGIPALKELASTYRCNALPRVTTTTFDNTAQELAADGFPPQQTRNPTIVARRKIVDDP